MATIYDAVATKSDTEKFPQPTKAWWNYLRVSCAAHLAYEAGALVVYMAAALGSPTKSPDDRNELLRNFIDGAQPPVEPEQIHDFTRGARFAASNLIAVEIAAKETK